MMPTHGASCLFFLPTHAGKNFCSFARDAIKDGALNDAENATPKIEISIPTIMNE